MSFEKVFTHGNLVDVNIRIWSGERKLQPEDLGLKSENLPGVFTLGKKKLVPAEVMNEFKHLDYLARQCLRKHSFEFAFGQARFVPKKKFLEFVSEMDPIIQEFNQKVEEFIRRYQGYKVNMRKDYVRAAHEAYLRACKLVKGFDVDRDKFVNEFLTRVESFYPDKDDLARRFEIEYVVFQASLPDLAQATYADIAEESEKIKLMQQAYERSLYRKVERFLEDSLGELRKRAEDALQGLTDALKGKKKFTEATINRVRNLVDEYASLDFIGDTAFLDKLLDFKKRIADRYTAAQLRENDRARTAILDEVRILLTIARDKSEIVRLTQAYKGQIGLAA